MYSTKELIQIFTTWRSDPYNIIVAIACMAEGFLAMFLFLCFLTDLNNYSDPGIYNAPNNKGAVICGKAIIIIEDERTPDQIEMDFNYLMAMRAMYCLPMRDQANN